MKISIKKLEEFSALYNEIDKDMHKISIEISEQCDRFCSDRYDRYGGFSIGEKYIIIWNSYTDCPDYDINFDLYLRWKSGEKINWKNEKLEVEV